MQSLKSVLRYIENITGCEICIVKYIPDPHMAIPFAKDFFSSGKYCRILMLIGIYRNEKPIPETNQRTNGPVNAHLISWPSKAQNIQSLENTW